MFLFNDIIIRMTHVVKIACDIVVYICQYECFIFFFLHLLNAKMVGVSLFYISGRFVFLGINIFTDTF